MIQTQATWFLIIELCWLSWSLDLYLVVPRRSMSLKRREASLLSSAKCRRSWDKRCPTRRATIESWVNGPNTMLSECCLGPPVFFFCPILSTWSWCLILFPYPQLTRIPRGPGLHRISENMSHGCRFSCHHPNLLPSRWSNQKKGWTTRVCRRHATGISSMRWRERKLEL